MLFRSNRHDGAFVVHMDGVLEIEVLDYRDFGTSRSVTMADRYMHSDQADIHDAVHKLEKFRSHSGHSDH